MQTYHIPALTISSLRNINPEFAKQYIINKLLIKHKNNERFFDNNHDVFIPF